MQVQAKIFSKLCGVEPEFSEERNANARAKSSPAILFLQHPEMQNLALNGNPKPPATANALRERPSMQMRAAHRLLTISNVDL